MIASRNPLNSDPTSAEPPPLVDLALRIETPENVVLTYTLAGPVLRGAAFLIDTAIRLTVFTTAAIILFCAATVAQGAAMGALLILWFGLSWWYYILFEGFWSGRTPGKWAVGLRVIQDKGYPITFWAAVARNLVRTADALGFYAAGFVTMMLSHRFKRLGDLLGRTVVVCERSVILPREPVILERIEPLPREEVPGPAPSIRTLTLIDQFLGRRHLISIPRGHDIARPLAKALARRLRYTGDLAAVERYPMAFLARVYVTFLRRDEEDEEALAKPARASIPLSAPFRQAAEAAS